MQKQFIAPAVICGKNGNNKCDFYTSSDHTNWTINKDNFTTGSYFLGAVYDHPNSHAECFYFNPNYPASEMIVESKAFLYQSGLNWSGVDNASCPTVTNEDVHEFVMPEACALSTTPPSKNKSK